MLLMYMWCVRVRVCLHAYVSAGQYARIPWCCHQTSIHFQIYTGDIGMNAIMCIMLQGKPDIRSLAWCGTFIDGSVVTTSHKL